MIPNHSQLINLMLGANPGFLAGRFATEFSASPGQDGERGTFRYFGAGYWDIRIDGGPTFQVTPELGHMRQTLIIDRTEPTDEDLADLETLKSGAT